MENQSDNHSEARELLSQFKRGLLSLEEVEQVQLDQGLIKKPYLRFRLTPQAKAELLEKSHLTPGTAETVRTAVRPGEDTSLNSYVRPAPPTEAAKPEPGGAEA